jgi:hypothetical protein
MQASKLGSGSTYLLCEPFVTPFGREPQGAGFLLRPIFKQLHFVKLRRIK